MATINPYLDFDGNTEEAFSFYKSVFGGEFMALMRRKDAPEQGKVPASDHEKIMHVALPIGKLRVLLNFTTGQMRKIEKVMNHQAN